MPDYTESIRYIYTFKLCHEHALIAAHIHSNSLTLDNICIKTIWMEMCASRWWNLIKLSRCAFIYIMRNFRREIREWKRERNWPWPWQKKKVLTMSTKNHNQSILYPESEFMNKPSQTNLFKRMIHSQIRHCCFSPDSLSLRNHTHRPLAERLMHMVHKIGNTLGVLKSSSDWLNYTGFPGEISVVCHVL